MRHFADRLRDAKTILWNGPMGIFEVEAFAAGTFGLARAMAEASGRGAVTVVGGGDSVAAIQQSGLAERFTQFVALGAPGHLRQRFYELLFGVVQIPDLFHERFAEVVCRHVWFSFVDAAQPQSSNG